MENLRFNSKGEIITRRTFACGKDSIESVNVHMCKNGRLGLLINCGTGTLKTSSITSIVNRFREYTEFWTASGSMYKVIYNDFADMDHIGKIKQVIRNINGLDDMSFEEDMKKKYNLFQGYTKTGKETIFLQHNGPTKSQMLRQGIKLHLSVGGYVDDYELLLSNLIPLMNKYGLTYKVVAPCNFERFLPGETKQAGKYITIYPCKCNMQGFLRDADEFLQKRDVIKIAGDKHFYGRIFGRYGSMKDHKIFDNEGNEYLDDRTKPYPDFIDGICIDDFIDMCR